MTATLIFPAPLLAPLLTWESTTEVNPPLLVAGIPNATFAGDHFVVERSNAVSDGMGGLESDGVWTEYVDATITDPNGVEQSGTAAVFAHGNYVLRARMKRGAGFSAWSTEVNINISLPVIVALSPGDNAVGVPLAANLTATFSKSVLFHSVVDIKLYKIDNTLVQAFTAADIGTGISISGAVLTINPTSDLINNQAYYVRIGATSIKDSAGFYFAGILDNTTWSFTSLVGSVPATVVKEDNTYLLTPIGEGGTYTFSGRTIGTNAGSDRLVVAAGLRYVGVPGITSVTVNGNAATLVVYNVSGRLASGLYIIDHPGGTTADIVVTGTNGGTNCGLGIWRMTGVASAVASDTGADDSSNPLNDTIAVPANGVLIGYSRTQVGGSVSTCAWTSPLSENFDTLIVASLYYHSGASVASGAGGAILAEATWSPTPSIHNAVFAAWGPV